MVEMALISSYMVMKEMMSSGVQDETKASISGEDQVKMKFIVVPRMTLPL